MKITINTTVTAHVYVPPAIFKYIGKLNSTTRNNWNQSWEAVKDELLNKLEEIDDIHADCPLPIRNYLEQMARLLQQQIEDIGDVHFYEEAPRNLKTVIEA